jgi:hypothetical protein
MPAVPASRRRLMRWARTVNDMARLDLGVGDCVYYYGGSKHFADGNIEVTHGAMADVLSIDRAKGLVTVRFKQDVFVGRFASLLSSGVCMHARLFRRTPPPSIPKYPLGTRLFLQVWGATDMSWKWNSASAVEVIGLASKRIDGNGRADFRFGIDGSQIFVRSQSDSEQFQYPHEWLSTQPSAPYPPGFAPGTRVFYLVDDRKAGDRPPYGSAGLVVGKGDGLEESRKGHLAVFFVDLNGIVFHPTSALGLRPPPALAGGFACQDKLFFVAPSQTTEIGLRGRTSETPHIERRALLCTRLHAQPHRATAGGRGIQPRLASILDH